MAIELATAYVNLTVSARGIQNDIRRELNAPVEKAAAESGRKSGAQFRGGFSGAFQQLRAEATGASGFLGGVEKDSSRVGSVMKDNLAAGAIAAGAAIGGLAIKAVTDFQNLALEVGKFGDATGLAYEDASLLVDLAGDLGLSVGTLQGSVQRFNREVGAGNVDLKQFGTDLVYAKDGSIDAFESFINAATALGAIEDSTVQAREAQRLFGRSYGDIAELMKMDAEELRAKLAEVPATNIFTDEKVQQARDFRQAVEDLKGRAEELTLAVGGRLVPQLSGLATVFLDLYDGANALAGDEGSGLRKVLDFVDRMINPVSALSTSWEDAKEEIKGVTLEFPGLTEAIIDGVAANEENAEAAEWNATAIVDLQLAARNAERAARDYERAWDSLTGALSDRSSFLGLQTTFDDLKVKAEESWQASASGAEDAERVAREYEQAVIDAKLQVIEYGREILGLPAEQVTALTLIDNVDELEQRIAILTRNRTMNIDLITRGAIGYGDTRDGPRATGGDVYGTHLVGEQGPELVTFGTPGYVTPYQQTRDLLDLAARSGSGSGDVIVNNHNRPTTVDELSRAIQMARLS